MYTKSQVRIASIIASFIWVAFFSIALDSEGSAAIMFFDRSTDVFLYPFTLQNIMWLIFFIGIGELFYRHLYSKNDLEDLKMRYLLEGQGLFYDTKELTGVMTKIQGKEGRLPKLINSLFMRYQASQKSPGETHQMLNSQLEIMQFKLDVDYNMIRYIAWLIPTLGFIGTVVGIAEALAYAGIPGKAEDELFLSALTSMLAVAFNTTLVALIMSAVLVYIMHLMQGREESILQRCGEYCLDNFINRLISK